MGADKGHCIEGIGTGSLSNSLLEKEQHKSREAKKEVRLSGEKDEFHKVKQQVTRLEFPHFPPSNILFSTSTSPHCPLMKEKETPRMQSALISRNK